MHVSNGIALNHLDRTADSTGLIQHAVHSISRRESGYHPLFVFNQLGDLERVMLRRGNHASAELWRRVLLPVNER